MFCKLCYQWKGFQRALKALNIAETNVLPEEQVRCSPLFSILIYFFLSKYARQFWTSCKYIWSYPRPLKCILTLNCFKGVTFAIAVADPGGRGGGGGGRGNPPPPIFRLNWGLKDQKNFLVFLHPSPHLNSYFSPKFTKKENMVTERILVQFYSLKSLCRK